RNLDCRDAPGVQAPAEPDDVPGGSAARDVEAGHQRLIGEHFYLPFLRRIDSGGVDELQLGSAGRKPADADADRVRILAVELDVCLDLLFVRPVRGPGVDRAMGPALLF